MSHDPRRCPLCARLRHPSQRAALRELPRLLHAQTRRAT